MKFDTRAYELACRVARISASMSASILDAHLRKNLHENYLRAYYQQCEVEGMSNDDTVALLAYAQGDME